MIQPVRSASAAAFVAVVAFAAGWSGPAPADTPEVPAFAQELEGKAQDIRPQDIVHWEPFDAQEQDDGKVAVSVRMTASDGWKVYATNLAFSGPAGFKLVGTTPPPARKFMDPISNEEVDVYDGGEFTVTFQSVAKWQEPTFPLSAKYVGCTNVICLFPYTETMAVPFRTQAPASIGVDPTPGATDPSLEEEDLQSRMARMLTGGDLSIGALFALVFVGGLLSNLTPCVYPMIPITLRLLAPKGASPYLRASWYALGIVVTYSALGLVAALSGGLFGSLLASKAFNITFAIIMMSLGISMLGFGNFARLQMLGSKLGGGKPSSKNAFLMGTGAGLVAAPCTGPILAALLAYAAKNNAGPGMSTGLLACYSVGFALPYMFLGGAAAKMSSVKIPHHFQVAVKLLFASIMFGLGLYYLRIPFYSVLDQLKPYWETAAIGGLVGGLILSAIWVLVPALQMSKKTMIFPTIVLGTGIFATTQWATSTPVHASAGQHYSSETDAFAAGKSAMKPILIDMWAEWCEACKKMDGTTFTDPKVIELLDTGWVSAKLDLTEDSDFNTEIQTRYGLQSLPTLVMLPADGDMSKKELITGYVSAGTLLNHLRQFQQRQAE